MSKIKYLLQGLIDELKSIFYPFLSQKIVALILIAFIAVVIVSLLSTAR